MYRVIVAGSTDQYFTDVDKAAHALQIAIHTARWKAKRGELPATWFCRFEWADKQGRFQSCDTITPDKLGPPTCIKIPPNNVGRRVEHF